jgi:hypothetical protein
MLFRPRSLVDADVLRAVAVAECLMKIDALAPVAVDWVTIASERLLLVKVLSLPILPVPGSLEESMVAEIAQCQARARFFDILADVAPDIHFDPVTGPLTPRDACFVDLSLRLIEIEWLDRARRATSEEDRRYNEASAKATREQRKVLFPSTTNDVVSLDGEPYRVVTLGVSTDEETARLVADALSLAATLHADPRSAGRVDDIARVFASQLPRREP